MQLVRMQILEDIRKECDTVLHELQAVQGLEAWGAKVSPIFSQQFSHMASRWPLLFSRLLGAQSHLMEELQAQSARMTHAWLQRSVATSVTEANPTSNMAKSLLQPGLLTGAQSAWSQIAKQWIESGQQATNHVLKEHV